MINFYSTKGPYGCFSNFSRHPVVYAGVTWPTSEHAYQAYKFVDSDPEHFAAIKSCTTPRLAADMGRDTSHKLRADWESVKDSIMRSVLVAKFSDPELKAILLGTGDEVLVEHTVNDSYWGDGGDGSGRNMLGKLLMEVREQFRNEHV